MEAMFFGKEAGNGAPCMIGFGIKACQTLMYRAAMYRAAAAGNATATGTVTRSA
jgi:hypothetical protein